MATKDKHFEFCAQLMLWIFGLFGGATRGKKVQSEVRLCGSPGHAAAKERKPRLLSY
jgi:hypothetical protein